MERGARRQGEDERALRVVAEAELLHGRERLLDEALDRGPVTAAERAEAALGKRDHDAGPAVVPRPTSTAWAKIESARSGSPPRRKA